MDNALQSITVISGILSVVVLIVFFVMAANISSIKKDLKQSKFNDLRLAFMDGKAKQAKCKSCNREFLYIGDKSAHCPFCYKINEISDEK